MSSDRITARNRANAQKSTGPSSARGKAVVAQNARRHGATSKPHPASVAAWLRIILDKPDLDMSDVLGNDTRISCALALAEAEVKMWTTRSALDAFERGHVSGSDSQVSQPDGGVSQPDTVQVLQHCAESINEVLWEPDTTAKERRSGLSLLGRLAKLILRETGHGGPRHLLLQRYAREARGHRKRAFQAWIACLKQRNAQAGKQASERHLPKQSQIQPKEEYSVKNM